MPLLLSRPRGQGAPEASPFPPYFPPPPLFLHSLNPKQQAHHHMAVGSPLSPSSGTWNDEQWQLAHTGQ